MAANEKSMAPFRAQEAAWKQGIDAAKKVNAMNDPKVAAAYQWEAGVQAQIDARDAAKAASVAQKTAAMQAKLDLAE